MDSLIGPIPDGWRIQPLNACCELQPGPGGSALRATDYVPVGGVPVVNAQDIDRGRISIPQANVSAEAATRRLDRYRIIPGDILLVRVGGAIRHALTGPEHDQWVQGGSCIRLRTQGDVLPAYLSCYLTHPAVGDWLLRRTRRGVVSTRTPATIATLPIVIPRTEAQLATIEAIEAIDAKIQVYEEIVQATGALRDLVLQQLLSGDLTPA
ncbi:restriction endonuclease subunit S [Micromonospora sp. CA-259024]|uniref:restriction endonuclease subunit S n=1 Tax=Micromonospora sp. CA-259024 TaxID=3239965 RepID=UPI003D9283C9